MFFCNHHHHHHYYHDHHCHHHHHLNLESAKYIELQFLSVGDKDVNMGVAKGRVCMYTEEADQRMKPLQGKTQPGEGATWWIKCFPPGP